jgi:hypothetical protein
MSGENSWRMLREKHCHLLQCILKVTDEDAHETSVTLYQTARNNNIGTMIFTAVVTLTSSAVLPCFSFPVNPTQSVCTQTGHKQTSTECHCRLWTVSDSQRKVSTGGQLV